jgi:hypothetical protein
LFKPIKNLLAVYSSFSSTADLSGYFLELSVRILNSSGRAAVLTPNKWFRAAYGEGLRRFLRASTKLHLVIDFGHAKNLFGNADTFPACLVFSQAHEDLDGQASLRFVRAFDQDRTQHSLLELVASHASLVTYDSLAANGWVFNDSRVSRILDNMRERSLTLTEYVGRTPLYGLKTGLNEAFYMDEGTAQAVITGEPHSSIQRSQYIPRVA